MFVDIAGWFGVVLLLAAYALVSAKRLEGDSILYQTMNILGGVLLITNSYYFHAIPSVVVNVAWIGIAFFALFRRYRAGRKETA
jgi:hypothetical protein